MKRDLIEGKLKGNQKGYAFLIPTDTNIEDYFIPHSNLKGAMHGDIVLAEKTNGEGNRTTARVVKILERTIVKLAGTYFTSRNGGFVVPDDKNYFNDIFIPQGVSLRVKNGDKVVCKITSYPKKKNPEGIIIKILGKQYEKNAELNALLYSYNLPEKFPKLVLEQADKLELDLSNKNLKNRKDFCAEQIVTIDGEDARDFDDAVSIKKFDNYFELGVHIADVSHYVPQGSIIDGEAFNRATSVYFPEKVIPMLPEKLCNDLCSLVEGEKRLTLSCIMKIDKNGKLLDTEITPSIIKSSKRFTYTLVQKILDGDKTAVNENQQFLDLIYNANSLADILIKKRNKNGSIDLDVKETQVVVDGEGVIHLNKDARDKAHKIIEEFMILANCAVAETFFFLDLPFIYRIHEQPTQEKLDIFYEFLDSVGVKLKRKKEQVFSKDFQLILEQNAEKDCFSLINRVMLRTMQKAKYSDKELGHFGLSEKYYCHFTSPIRRYPDLVIHRVIKDFYNHGQEFCVKKYSGVVKQASIQSSQKEITAQEAERAVDDLYKLLYIEDYIGEEYDAIVSGVTNYSVYAELDNGVEGYIKIENLKGAGYELSTNKYLLSNGKKTYKLGQKIKIKVVGVDYSTKKAEFLLVE